MQRVKVAPEKAVPDETQQIDGDLYHTDLRNKSKYSKVFKKVLITTEESQNPDELVIINFFYANFVFIYSFSHLFIFFFFGGGGVV